MKVVSHEKEKRGYVVDVKEENPEKIELTNYGLQDGDPEVIVDSINIDLIKGSYKALNVFVAENIGNDPEYVVTSRAMNLIFN